MLKNINIECTGKKRLASNIHALDKPTCFVDSRFNKKK